MWLATMLRKRHQCRIKPPEWMDATNLGNVLKDEKANATAWQQLPYHYIEIAKLLFTKAEEDFAEFEMDVHEVSFGCGSKRALAASTLLPPIDFDSLNPPLNDDARR